MTTKSAAGAHSEKDSAAKPRRINIALQGGGSHGAFAWGVIDRLLEHGGVEIEGIVGTSAGAMNAAVTAYGLMKGGNEGARGRLYAFWHSISEAARFSLLQPPPWSKLMEPNSGSLDMAPGYIFSDFISRMFSPYQTNPLNLNPLRDVLLATVDFEELRKQSHVKLFVSASNVMNNRLRIFAGNEVTVDAVLASACLPFMFKAVEIDGEFFWDGGYMGNPPLYPLIYNCESRDVLIIQLNPINIDKVPNTAQEILDRINTLSFNSSLMREMRAINFVEQIVDNGYDHDGRLKKMFIHTIDGEHTLNKLGVSSKLNADWDFIMHLRALGRTAAEQFIEQDFDKIGVSSSTNIVTKFL